MSRIQVGCVVVLLFAGCAARNPAPIIDRSLSAVVVPPAHGITPTSVAQPGTYVVKKGDTLYRIALDHGMAYGDLASWNGLADVNDIKVDQVLRLVPPDVPPGVEVRPLNDSPAPVLSTQTAPAHPVETLSYPKTVKLPYASQAAENIANQADGQPSVANSSSDVKRTADKTPAAGRTSAADGAKTQENSAGKDATSVKVGDENAVDWILPTAGKLLNKFTDDVKGIDFAGEMGQPVLAAGPGKVVYAGSGLRGYGKMVIIKHNSAYLSAYAHNSKLLVKEGDNIKRGEKIAEMGNSDTDQVKLHFEIRKFGKPVDPAKFITADK